MSSTRIHSRTRIAPGVARTIEVGGASKATLRWQLRHAGIELNAAAEALFTHAGFETSPDSSALETVEISVADLGLRRGAQIAEIHGRARDCGLALCPLEVGPSMRLQWLEQPEGFVGQPASQHRAPPGSVTIASAPLTGDDDVPKGFYLRRIEGVLWLRGYRSGADHLWSPEDRFVFCRV